MQGGWHFDFRAVHESVGDDWAAHLKYRVALWHGAATVAGAGVVASLWLDAACKV